MTGEDLITRLGVISVSVFTIGRLHGIKELENLSMQMNELADDISRYDWHTGTPTEEGWYLIKYRGIYGSAIGRMEYRAVHRYRLDGFPMIDGGIGADDIWKPIEWQKIEEKENGHTD